MLNIINPNNRGSVGKAISTTLKPVTSDKETERGVRKNNKKNAFLRLKTGIKTIAIKIGKINAI